MLATTVTDLFLIEGLGLLQISTQSDLADLRHAKEKLWIRFQCIISIPSAECQVVKGNMKNDTNLNINKWQIYGTLLWCVTIEGTV